MNGDDQKNENVWIELKNEAMLPLLPQIDNLLVHSKVSTKINPISKFESNDKKYDNLCHLLLLTVGVKKKEPTNRRAYSIIGVLKIGHIVFKS
jgi:hypothetical protein